MRKAADKKKKERVDVRKTMIMINKANQGDNGNYSCFVFNDLGNVTINWELKVKPESGLIGIIVSSILINVKFVKKF